MRHESAMGRTRSLAPGPKSDLRQDWPTSGPWKGRLATMAGFADVGDPCALQNRADDRPHVRLSSTTSTRNLARFWFTAGPSSQRQ
jgi:hypothetical protein